MSKLFDKKMAQKGGMMIEALAMLGLIAVVTPTMYKKSAERTLEVEDINTATSMRSVMSAADSYVSSHYGELVQEMHGDGSGDVVYKAIPMNKLKQYLPYSFNESKLYDFGTPEVAVARQGNNLTAFVLFPAKADGDEGLGQERTVRIATLVGANGGYVNGSGAKGIGGIWSLDDNQLNELFTGDKKLYSIVTASSDAINNTNVEEDTDKFLYRTDDNGKWHNTMRTDLYMGGFNNETDDAYIRDGDTTAANPRRYSIRDVKRLIIGTNSVIEDYAQPDDPKNQNTIDNAEKANDNPTRKYGLYMKDTGASAANAIDSAFIYGSLNAAKENLIADENSLKFGKPTIDPDHPELNNNFSFNVSSSSLKFGDHAGYNFEVTDDGTIKNKKNLELADDIGDDVNPGWTYANIGRLGGLGRYLISGAYDSGKGELTLMDADTLVIKGRQKEGENFSKDFADRIVIDQNGIKGDVNVATWADTHFVKYNNTDPVPVFPVRVGSNAKVDGILATAQLDTQNIRAATLDVGSENINDANKWLKVDANGIHGKNPADAGDGKTNTVFDVKNGEVNIATGAFARNSGNFGIANGAQNLFNLTQNTGAELASTRKIDIFMDDVTNNNQTDPNELNLRNTKIQEQLKGSDVVFSSLETGNNKTTSVKVKGTNFQVSDIDSDGHEHIVLSVKGNNANNNTLDPMTRGSSETANVAVHGETLFTSSLDNSVSADRKYMKVGSNHNTDAVVNILSKDEGNKQKNVLTVEGDTLYNQDTKTEYKDSTNGGTVYVRKGMVEVNPATSTYQNTIGKTNANAGYGVVKASRFVANNVNLTGDATKDPTKVPQFFSDADYKSYNGATNTNGRYDTYMVNPAYTSVMHDIKLTTRGGARLSDILPDFINKGIYITSNTYKDDIESLQFKLKSGKVEPVVGTSTQLTGQINLGESDSWASPYLGFVPAPQCPPGYNRLITLAPQSFMMAQAGQMQQGSHARGGNAYYVKNQVPDDSAFTEYERMKSSGGAYTSQGFVSGMTASAATDVATTGEVHQGDLTGVYNGTVVLTDIPLNVKASYQDASGNTHNMALEPKTGEDPLYFMVSTGDLTPPLTIQQSTWLKTNVIPVGSKNQSYSIDKTLDSDDYVKGWAALMGFVYDAATYKPVTDVLGSQSTPNKLIGYDGSNGSVFWNVFPVRRNTLEAYATTYCYFDRNGILWSELKNRDSSNNVDKSLGHGEYIDHYNALLDYKDNTAKKNSSNVYKQRLNDPTLKYDEVW